MIFMRSTASSLVLAVSAAMFAAPAAAAPGGSPTPATAPAALADIPRASFIATMDAEFRKKDVDSDSKLTRAEIEQYERNTIVTSALATNRQNFTQLDTDHDSVATAAEMRAGGLAPTVR